MTWQADIIRSYAGGLTTFVETGTGDGGTTVALMDDFTQVWTMDLDHRAYLDAVLRHRHHAWVHPLFGDSAFLVPWLLANVLKRPAVFFLDAHFCGGVSGEHETPILEELQAIVATGRPNVILIDDARLFGAKPVYPHVEQWPTIRQVADVLVGYEVQTLHDVIRATPCA